MGVLEERLLIGGVLAFVRVIASRGRGGSVGLPDIPRAAMKIFLAVLFLAACGPAEPEPAAARGEPARQVEADERRVDLDFVNAPLPDFLNYFAQVFDADLVVTTPLDPGIGVTARADRMAIDEIGPWLQQVMAGHGYTVSVEGGKMFVDALHPRSSAQGVIAMEATLAAWNPVGHPKATVLEKLGEPTSVQGQVLFYRFDSGLGGWEWRVLLDEHERVSSVERHSLE